MIEWAVYIASSVGVGGQMRRCGYVDSSMHRRSDGLMMVMCCAE